MKSRLSRTFTISLFGLLSFWSLHLSAQILETETNWGSNDIETWIHKNASGQLISVGITIPAMLLDQLPSEPIEIVARFPHSSLVPFKHMYFVWEPHGHEPPGVYDIPHFDLHFYLISNSERANISCSGDDAAICMKQPDASAIPSNYASTPAGVPEMGWHWLDLLSPEFHGQTFTSTMIYGYYNGKLTFLEPMVTRAYLKSKPQFTAEIRQPAVYPRPGYYPISYRVTYVSANDSYQIALTQLTFRK